jgi:branched-chain amino acid transport system ATP-binding protein
MPLEVQGVSAGYGRGTIISGIDLTVRPGEIVALIGANGAGKSTLLKAISGLIPITAGTIRFQGTAIEDLAPAGRVRAGLVHVPEGRQIFPGMSVAQNLSLGGYLRRDDNDYEQRLAEILRTFPALGSRLTNLAGNLSGGQQQMLAFGRGLMAGPRLMMLDEPSLGLAPKLVREIFDLISDLKRQGISILLSEQNARLSLSIADRGYVLENGRISLQGGGHELLHSKDVAEKYLGVGAAAGAGSSDKIAELSKHLRNLLQRSASY